ncbi:alpha-ketoglutarate-dependent taurine dioxygenase [Coprinopsis cinerea AmutBmut pab1-1]|nr:alpha-ketoglutarate-dependent taurine dioxygenase [Coprinopsis cinerea AmutBmut pab1-1]
MAPSVSEIVHHESPVPTNNPKKWHRVDLSNKYPPNSNLEERLEQHQPFEHVDPGSRADPTLPRLLSPNTKVKHLSPYIGTELSGIQLSQLTKEGLDELGLFVAQRKLVIFREQDFQDLPPEKQVAIAAHFGVPHLHATLPNIEGHPAYVNLLRQPGKRNINDYFIDTFLSYAFWHSDVSYEPQPPSTTFFWPLDQPTVGGDTLFLSTTEAYNRLSPEFQKRLVGLKALHSGVAQVEESRRSGGAVRKEPVEAVHPVIRVHPVTGEKSIFVNPAFTRHIVGLKKEESDALLKFLYDHIAKGADFQVRARHEPGSVIIWDNRVTNHSAVPDYGKDVRRHNLRLTPLGEVPIPAQ